MGRTYSSAVGCKNRRQGSKSLFSPPRVPVELPSHATQHADVALGEAGAPEETAELKHHVMRILRVEEPDPAQRLFELRVHLLRRRVGGEDLRRGGLALQASEQKLVAEDRDRGGEVQAARSGLGRYSDERLAQQEVFVDEAGILGSEDQSGALAPRDAEDPGGEGSRSVDLAAVSAGLGRGPDGKADAAQGGAERAKGCAPIRGP